MISTVILDRGSPSPSPQRRSPTAAWHALAQHHAQRRPHPYPHSKLQRNLSTATDLHEHEDVEDHRVVLRGVCGARFPRQQRLFTAESHHSGDVDV
eukprot:1771770-Rhodomonas_salina.2